MLDGTKTATTRPRRFAQVGDWFQAFGSTFRIHQVVLCNLHAVEKFYYQQEGFGTPDGFRDCWVSIHPKKGWDGSQQVYLHLFERTDGKHGTGKGQGTLAFG